MLLDCTLRDGGYYTNWEYSNELLEDLIKFHYKYTNIAFEFGYLNLKKEKEFKGLCAESPFEYCQYLFNKFTGKKNWPLKKRVFIMLNSNEIANLNIHEKTKIILSIKESIFFNGIRIATDKIFYKEVLDFISLARENNIFCIINFMKIDKVKDSEIDEIIEQLAKKNKQSRPNVFYLADSFGSLFMLETKYLVNKFKAKLSDLNIELGFHAHNNKGLGLANTFEAINNGAEWCDGSWLGMGRGAGNAEIEHLILNNLINEESIKFKSKISSEMQNLIEKHFIPLRAKYNWGKNIFYDLSSSVGLHPTKCLNLINSHKLSKYTKAYSILSTTNMHYKKEKVFKGFDINLLKDHLKKIPILVYSGDSAIKNITGLNFLEQSNKYFLIRINYSSVFDTLKTKFIMTSSSQRLIQFLAENDAGKNKLVCITPEYCLKEAAINNNFKNLIIYKEKAIYKYSIDFALSLLSDIGYRKVKVIGLDGKSNLTLKGKEEFNDTKEIIRNFSKYLTIESLTNTPYNITLTPIYSIMK